MGRHLTILQINDLHAYLTPHPEIFDLLEPTTLTPGGGLARIAAIFGAVRQEVGAAVVALDNGDTSPGTLPAVASRGTALVQETPTSYGLSATVAGVLFGLVTGPILVSFASTIGATLAFLVSRFVLRDWVGARFGDRLTTATARRSSVARARCPNRAPGWSSSHRRMGTRTS